MLLVSTRKNIKLEEGAWKLVRGTVLFKQYGSNIQKDKEYSVYAFDLVNYGLT